MRLEHNMVSIKEKKERKKLNSSSPKTWGIHHIPMSLWSLNYNDIIFFFFKNAIFTWVSSHENTKPSEYYYFFSAFKQRK